MHTAWKKLDLLGNADCRAILGLSRLFDAPFEANAGEMLLDLGD
jgi:hypothetical protein